MRHAGKLVCGPAAVLLGVAFGGCDPAQNPAPVSPIGLSSDRPELSLTLPARPLDQARVLRAAELHWLAKRSARALEDLGELLRIYPDHLEGRILRAIVLAAQGQQKKAEAAWRRAERIIVVKGKRRAFTLQTTLLFAAEHYLAGSFEGDIELSRRRADLFVKELWRRFPEADAAARAQLMVARFAAKARQWERVQRVCETLRRVQPGHRANVTCARLSLAARRLQQVGRLAAPAAVKWVWEAPLPQGNALNDVWVGRDGRQVLVGDAGTVLVRPKRRGRYRLLPAPTRWNLRSVSGASWDSLYIVGDGGLVLALQAGKLSWLRHPRPLQPDLHGVWSAARGQLLAVGESGTVVRYRDRRWDVAQPTKQSLHAVWGSSPNNVFAAGDEGTMLHFDGVRWRTFRSDAYETLRGIHGSAVDNVLIAGDNKTIIFFDGKRAKETVQGLASYLDIWAPTGGLAWVVGRGGTILRGGRQRLADWQREPTHTMVDLRAIAGRSQREVVVVGQGGTILARRGRGWKLVGGGLSEALVGVYSGNVAGTGVALGVRGRLLWRQKRRWQATLMPVRGRYRGLWSNGTRTAAVGDHGLLVVGRDRAFHKIATGTHEALLAVFGCGALLRTVGSRGTLLEISGSQVRSIAVPTAHTLWGVGGCAYPMAVGDRGTIVVSKRDGWRREDSGTLRRLRAVQVFAGGEAIAVGDGGAILHRKRGIWHTRRSPTAQHLVAVHGRHSSDVYAVTNGGIVIHYDGKRWRLQSSPAGCLFAVHAGPKEALAVGCAGGVIRSSEQ